MRRGLRSALRRPPLKVRITVASSASIAVILVALSLLVYGRLHVELLRALDSGLQARASAIAGSIGQLSQVSRAISDGPDARSAAATQILTPGGHVLARSGTAIPRLSARYLRELSRPAFIDVPGHRPAAPMRLYVLPVNEGRPLVIVTGATLASLIRTMRGLGLLLLVGAPVAIALASIVAWLMAGAALRPVERMRREAATFSGSDPARRLPVPQTNDEVARLGETLNGLLDRLQAARDRERRLLDDASHELRTPLSTLKAEIDLALSRARSADELHAALRSASQETNRLARLAQDVLVLSRARDGGLRIHRVRTDIGELLQRACARHRPRAAQADCRIECHVPEADFPADSMRLTQAVDNLLDNAIRYSDTGGLIEVQADVDNDAATITIRNSGAGFPSPILDRAFEPFVSGGQHPATRRDQREGASQEQPGAGLGLAIVRAVARAHDGTVTASNTPAGAVVTMTLRLSPLPATSQATVAR